VGTLYLAALIFGLGTILVQLFGSSHGDADHPGDLHDGSSDAHGDGHADHSGGILPIVLSLRFWTFGSLAFGLTGALLHYLGLAPVPIALVLAMAMGLGSGWFAAWSLRALMKTATQSGAAAGDAVGKLGRVLVSCQRGGRGKVRLELRGQSVDFLATTDEDEIEPGESVLVEEVREGEVHVSRAPAELGLRE
jgi:membrane protein implicated in regulation of membrane protease activity